MIPNMNTILLVSHYTSKFESFFVFLPFYVHHLFGEGAIQSNRLCDLLRMEHAHKLFDIIPQCPNWVSVFFFCKSLVTCLIRNKARDFSIPLHFSLIFPLLLFSSLSLPKLETKKTQDFLLLRIHEDSFAE